MTSTRHPVSFIATSTPDAAQAFYADVLNLALIDASPFALVFMDKDHMLRVQIVAEFTPPPYTVHGWRVPDITSEIATLSARGVHFETFTGLDQDKDGIWTTSNGDKIAWFKDPSGNMLSLTEFCTPTARS